MAGIGVSTGTATALAGEQSARMTPRMWKIDNNCLFGSLFLGGAEPVFLNLAVEGPLADPQ
jgi:hypothetical protein